MPQYQTCPGCGSNLDHGERCDCRDEPTELVAPVTRQERMSAMLPAMEKRDRIISREGDANGARLTPWYLNLLIEEQIRQRRMTEYCVLRYKEKRATGLADDPFTTPSLYHNENNLSSEENENVS